MGVRLLATAEPGSGLSFFQQRRHCSEFLSLVRSLNRVRHRPVVTRAPAACCLGSRPKQPSGQRKSCIGKQRGDVNMP